MIYVIIGQTLTGKTTLANKLVEETGIEKIITYTNRPIREGEIDGVDYHFVTTEEIMSNEFFGHRFFYTAYRDGPFIYAMKEEDFVPYGDKIIVADPTGFKAIKDLIGRDAVSVFLNIPNETIKKRALQRGDSIEEVERRLKVDNPLFLHADIYCDVVLNEGDDMVDIMTKIIKGEVHL